MKPSEYKLDSAVRTAPEPLRIASYNIHRAVGSDRCRDPARVAAVIDELHADVIGLQEVDWHHDQICQESQSEYLAHLPGYRAVAGPNIRDHRGHYGNLLLTRMPAQRIRRVDLSEPGREPRGAIDVDLLIGGNRLRVIVTHLGLAVRERRRQAARLRDVVLDRPDQPTLILGDFNDWLPGGLSLRPLLAVCGATAHPGSFPSFWPILALDRILAYALPLRPLVRTHVSPLARKASDHLPIIAEFEAGAILPRAQMSQQLRAIDEVTALETQYQSA